MQATTPTLPLYKKQQALLGFGGKGCDDLIILGLGFGRLLCTLEEKHHLQHRFRLKQVVAHCVQRVNDYSDIQIHPIRQTSERTTQLLGGQQNPGLAFCQPFRL